MLKLYLHIQEMFRLPFRQDGEVSVVLVAVERTLHASPSLLQISVEITRKKRFLLSVLVMAEHFLLACYFHL